MLLIFGWRPYFTTLAVVTFVCGFCHQNVPQQVYQRVNKFTLFFLPLFPTSTRHYVECSNCGGTRQITRQQADLMQQQAAQAPIRQQPPQPF